MSTVIVAQLTSMDDAHSSTSCFTAVSVLPSIATSFGLGLAAGGAGELMWAWLVCSVFTVRPQLSSGCKVDAFTSIECILPFFFPLDAQLRP